MKYRILRKVDKDTDTYLYKVQVRTWLGWKSTNYGVYTDYTLVQEALDRYKRQINLEDQFKVFEEGEL